MIYNPTNIKGFPEAISESNLYSFSDNCEGKVGDNRGEETEGVLSCLERLEFKLESCSKSFTKRVKCANPDCGKEDTSIVKLHCFIRFCSHETCYTNRFVKARKRLDSYSIKADRLLHVVIGFPTKAKHHRTDKQIQEKTMRKFSLELKKQGILLSGLRIFDFQDREDEYTHYHLAQLPLGKQYSDVRIWHEARRKTIDKTGVNFIVKIVGWKPKKSLLKYFAKRMAGKYGDGENSFFLSDVMTIQEYFHNFYRIRSLVKISRRLSCIIVPVLFRFLCPVCGFTECFVFFEPLNENQGADDG